MKRLLAIQSKLKVPKGQYNTFGKYKYRSCEDILEAVKPLLEKHQAVLLVSDAVVVVGDRYYVNAEARLMGTDGQTIAVTQAYAREEETKKGMDGSQITGAASSYSRKYALNGLFAIDDTKDADTLNRGAEPSDPPPHSELAQEEKPKDDTKSQIGKMLLEMCYGDKEQAALMLKGLTTFTNKDGKEIPGKTSIKTLSDKQAKVTLRKVKEQYDKWLDANKPPDGTPAEDGIELELDGV